MNYLKKINRHGLFLLLIFFASTALGQEIKKYDNEFLSIGVGARSLGMANSTVATVNDATASYWNPAGLTQIKNDYQIVAMHAEYFASIIKFDYLGGSYRIDTATTVGVSIIRSGVDNIQNTLELFDSEGNIDYNRIKHFSIADYAFIASYAKKSKIQGLRYAANVKIIYRNEGDFAKAWGFGLDAALQYDKGKWRVGVMAKDVTSTFSVWIIDEDKLKVSYDTDETRNEIPSNKMDISMPRLILGIAREFKLKKDFALLAEIDADITFDGKRNVLIKSDPISIDPRAGIEIDYKKIAYLRFGICNMQDESDFDGKNKFSFQPNFGLGIKFRNFTIDYALTDLGDNSIALYSNIFSLSYSFNKK